ncbi:hypothetical protein CVT26_009573 [Gymnopilus dilepis]|uniref:Uncharacterized protein n=1 Tax=Gymnopilus dilepis TaxID=231916 RepID=A0A409WUM5_9AGAR|nr:hypothetical protein CVT26_009573 [Gymnopilus dilepis]
MAFSTFFNSLYSDTNDVAQPCFYVVQRYMLAGTLNGHGRPPNAFAFNGTNTILASGGDDEEVRIWDIKRLRLCQRLVDPAGRWGQVTCVQFVNLDAHSNADWLCFGTGRGMLAMYRKSRRAAEFAEAWTLRIFAVGDSVEAFAYDSNHQRLAVSSHYGKLKMLRLQQGKFVESWEDELSDAIPRALFFSNNGHSVSIFAMESGAIFCRDVETSSTHSIKVLKTAIGYASHCQETGNILVDNMRNGFDLYPHNRNHPSRHFPVPATKMYVKAGVFGERGTIAVCGSDHGMVYVFGLADSKPKQTLLHGSGTDLVQVIETSSAQDDHLIASGISTGKCNICIWKRSKKHTARFDGGIMGERLMICNVLFILLFMWVTRETWLSYLNDMKTNFLQILTLYREIGRGR